MDIKSRSVRALRYAALALLVGVVGSTAVAENPAGQGYSLNMHGRSSVYSLNDFLSGCDKVCEFVAGSGNICVDSCFHVDVPVDGKGKVNHDGNFTLRITQNGQVLTDGNLRVALKGKVKGRNGATQVKLAMKLAGTIESDGQSLTAKGKAKFQGRVSESGTLSGDLDLKLCSKSTGCQSLPRVAVNAQLPPGNWRLDLDLSGDGDKKLGGSARAILSDGTSYNYTVKGKYNPSSDSARLKLKGSDGSKISLSGLTAESGVIQSGHLSYKLQGAQAKSNPF